MAGSATSIDGQRERHDSVMYAKIGIGFPIRGSNVSKSEFIFRAGATPEVNTIRETVDAATAELNGKILLGQPIVATSKRIPKKIVIQSSKISKLELLVKDLLKKVKSSMKKLNKESRKDQQLDEFRENCW